MIKTIILWIILTPVVFIVELLAFVIVPIAAIFADKTGRLPRWARAYETHDALGYVGPLTEPVTTRSYRIHQKLGLIHYLLRNKAYTFRYSIRARINRTATTHFYGSIVPPRYGFSYALVIKDSYWELQPRISIGIAYLYLRIGWKMMPFVQSHSDHPTAGLFIGIAVRSDDWEEFGL
jgi:hypothetical protein